jgi:hypothetical protein
MNLESKKISLVILGATALLCSRTFFYFIHDTEGPNLLIVVVLAIVIYLLSYAAYVFVPSNSKGLMKLAVAVGVQILSVVILHYCIR